MAHFYVQLLWDRTLLFVFLLTDFLILFFIGTSWYALETPTELKNFNHHWPFIGLGDLSNTRDNVFIDNLQVGITIICEGHSFRNVTKSRSNFSQISHSQPQFTTSVPPAHAQLLPQPRRCWHERISVTPVLPRQCWPEQLWVALASSFRSQGGVGPSNFQPRPLQSR